jgi:hypothetical protein
MKLLVPMTLRNSSEMVAEMDREVRKVGAIELHEMPVAMTTPRLK